jgi:hypothetical protein
MYDFARRHEEAAPHYQRYSRWTRTLCGRFGSLGGIMRPGRCLRTPSPPCKKAVKLSGRSAAIVGSLGAAYALSGRRAEAQELLDELIELSKRRYVPPHAMVPVLISLGKKDEAFKWLEKSYQERSNSMIYLKVSAGYDPLRSDPRFQDLVQRVGFPP